MFESLIEPLINWYDNGEWVPLLIGLAKRLAGALAIWFIGRWIARKIVRTTSSTMEKKDVEITLREFLENILYAILLAVIIVSVLSVLGVPITGLVAALGAASLAVGLALKDSLGNFAAGVMLILFRPFRVGDVVTVNGVTGKVAEVKIFSTILNTPDNQLVVVPNGNVINDTIINATHHDTRRVDMLYGISYDDNIDDAQALLLKLAKAHPKVLAEPEPISKVMELGGSSVNLSLRPWCKTEDYWDVMWDLTHQCKVELEKAGLSIPYPQQDVYLHDMGKPKEAAGNGS